MTEITETTLEAMITAALDARVPGGAEVSAWLPQKDAFTPHQTARDVMACALKAALGLKVAPERGLVAAARHLCDRLAAQRRGHGYAIAMTREMDDAVEAVLRALPPQEEKKT